MLLKIEPTKNKQIQCDLPSKWAKPAKRALALRPNVAADLQERAYQSQSSQFMYNALSFSFPLAQFNKQKSMHQQISTLTQE